MKKKQDYEDDKDDDKQEDGNRKWVTSAYNSYRSILPIHQLTPNTNTLHPFTPNRPWRPETSDTPSTQETMIEWWTRCYKLNVSNVNTHVTQPTINSHQSSFSPSLFSCLISTEKCYRPITTPGTSRKECKYYQHTIHTNPTTNITNSHQPHVLFLFFINRELMTQILDTFINPRT